MDASAAAAGRKRNLWAAFGLCAVTLLVYANSFQAGFTLDNGFILQQDRFHAATLHNAGLILRHTYWWPVAENGLYRPFTSLSYLFNYAVLGDTDHPAGYHWINLLLQAGNVVLAYFVALRFIRSFWPAFFTAGVWAVHPLLTESVTNIVGRADLLSGIAMLSGVLLYLRGTESSGLRKLGWLVGLMAVTAVGLFSKESSIMIVGVIALYEFAWWKTSGKTQNLIDGFLALLPPLLLFLYQRSAVLGAARPAFVAFADNPLTGAGFWTARLTALKVIAPYLALLAWPAKLSSDYSYAQIPLASGSLEDWVAWLAVAGGLGWLVWVYGYCRRAFFFASFALLTFLPASNLLFPIGTVMAERLLYLPSFGLIACVVPGIFLAGEKLRRSGLAPAIVCVMMAACGVRTWARNRDWKDDLSLAQATVRTSPLSFKSHLLLADALFAKGSNAAALEEAERSLVVLDSLPDSRNVWTAYRQAGAMYLAEGDRLRSADAGASGRAWQRSVELLARSTKIVEALPAVPVREGGVVLAHGAGECYRALSEANLRLMKTDEAYQAAARARDLDPSAPEAYRAMARALRTADRGADADVALAQGEFLTGDGALRGEAAGVSREVRCAGAAEAVRMLARTDRREMARMSVGKAVQGLGCDPAALEGILAGR